MFNLFMMEDMRKLDYTEMNKLELLLNICGIPYEKKIRFNGIQILYFGPTPKEREVCSVILTTASYGHKEGLLEISGLLTDEEYEEGSVLGWLSASNVFNRIAKHYKGNK